MRITFAHDLIRNGSRYEKGKSYEVEEEIAKALIVHGIAAEAKEPAAKRTAKTKTRRK